MNEKPNRVEGLKIKILDNTRCSGGTPVIGEWYDVTDIHRARKPLRREGVDTNVYFINVNGVRTGVHGVHCETNGYDCVSHTAEFFEKYRNEQELKAKVREEENIGIV